ncbi:MAG TPA: phosphoenolpyruvate--protein phosphotransferase [Patescibacteria group bacterium]|nr:phosphoenolpyruvate--protein phosphotransferase [Patescibacteria group bacterium]
MSARLQGVAAAPGVARAAPWIFRPPEADGGPRIPIADAARAAAAELERLATRLRDEGNEEEAAIFDAQSLMAVDEELIGVAKEREAAGEDAVDAMHAAGEATAAIFEGLDDELLAARAADVRDVAARIARHVVGGTAPSLEQRSIVVATDLAPSVTVELDRALLAGIALEGGSRTSHAAILARALGIPAVVSVPGLIERASAAGTLAIDGGSGLVVLDPDAAAIEELDRAAAANEESRAADEAFRDRPLATADGHRVACYANVGEPAEAAAAFAAGAEGIGLFRTEFAFAGRSTAPTEDEQAAAYEEVLRAAGDAEVIVRLADIGGDKPLPYLPIATEANPFLGVRAIRLATLHPELFATQARAILRASARAGRPASIMAPMVADAADVAYVRDLVAAARAEVPDAPAPRVGIMVEIPSAALLADQLAPMVDFMSIGTNDLTQYLLAVDRTNPALAERQDAVHPAVLRAIARVVEGAHASPNRCEVAVCGELAGDPQGAILLIGLGVDELSMGAGSIGAVKRAVAGRTRDEMAAIARQALTVESAAQVRALVGAA